MRCSLLCSQMGSILLETFRGFASTDTPTSHADSSFWPLGSYSTLQTLSLCKHRCVCNDFSSTSTLNKYAIKKQYFDVTVASKDMQFTWHRFSLENICIINFNCTPKCLALPACASGGGRKGGPSTRLKLCACPILPFCFEHFSCFAFILPSRRFFCVIILFLSGLWVTRSPQKVEKLVKKVQTEKKASTIKLYYIVGTNCIYLLSKWYFL